MPHPAFGWMGHSIWQSAPSTKSLAPRLIQATESPSDQSARASAGRLFDAANRPSQIGVPATDLVFQSGDRINFFNILQT